MARNKETQKPKRGKATQNDEPVLENDPADDKDDENLDNESENGPDPPVDPDNEKAQIKALLVLLARSNG